MRIVSIISSFILSPFAARNSLCKAGMDNGRVSRSCTSLSERKKSIQMILMMYCVTESRASLVECEIGRIKD